MIGIISDIHGNLAALEEVLSALSKKKIEKIICLGDVCGYYSNVNECCELVKNNCFMTLLGNHDWYISKNQKCPRSNSANVCLDFQRKIIKKENLQWLSKLHSKSNYEDLNIVHGGWIDPLDEYINLNEDYFLNLKGSFFASGHTHMPVLWSNSLKKYCNPGSVGQPRDGDYRASFATWDGKEFTIHRVHYDYCKTQLEMKKNGFDLYYYRNLEFGLKIGDVPSEAFK